MQVLQQTYDAGQLMTEIRSKSLIALGLGSNLSSERPVSSVQTLARRQLADFPGDRT